MSTHVHARGSATVHGIAKAASIHVCMYLHACPLCLQMSEHVGRPDGTKTPLPASCMHPNWVRVSARTFVHVDMVRMYERTLHTMHGSFQALTATHNSATIDLLRASQGVLVVCGGRECTWCGNRVVCGSLCVGVQEVVGKRRQTAVGGCRRLCLVTDSCAHSATLACVAAPVMCRGWRKTGPAGAAV